MRTNLKDPDLGGHISSFASSATLYDVALTTSLRRRRREHGGDLIYFQGHASPGIYARLYGRGCQNVDNAVVSFVGARFARPKTVCFVSSGRQTLPLQLTIG